MSSESENYIYRAPMVATLSPRREKLICYCCGAKTWTKVIASIQILYALTICVVWIITASSSSDSNPNDEESGVHLYFSVIYAYFAAPLPLRLAEAIMGIFLGVILLTGVHLSKSRCLIIWLVLRGLEIVLYLFILIGFLVGLFMGSGVSVVLFMIFLLIIIALQIFSFVVVYGYCKKLMELQNPNLDSANYFHSV